MSTQILFVCALVCLAGIQANPDTPEEKLGRALMAKNADPRWRPVMDAKTAVEVTVKPILAGVIEYETCRNTLGLHMYMFMTWKNPLFTWMPEDFNGVKQITMPATDVWTPDIEMMTSTDKRTTRLGDSMYMVMMMHDGTHMLMENDVYRTHDCTTRDNKHLQCKFMFGSYMFSDDLLNVKTDTPVTKYNIINDAYTLDTVTFERTDMKYPEIDNRNYPTLNLKVDITMMKEHTCDTCGTCGKCDKNMKTEF